MSWLGMEKAAFRYGHRCEYIEWAVTDSWQGVILQIRDWKRC